MHKSSLREIYKQKRRGLSSLEKSKLEDLMLIQFQKLQIKIPQVLMTYIPMQKFNEYNPALVERYCSFIAQGQQLVIPVVNGNDLNLIAVDEETVFRAGNFGVPEPVSGELVQPDELEVILTPLLIFDECGYRVGYGKGFYDRLFAKCNASVVKIGFCFFDPVKVITDISPLDVKLDYCITPNSVYNFD